MRETHEHCVARLQLRLFEQNDNILKVTVGQLLAMKSGIKDYDDDLVSSMCAHLDFV